MIFKRTIDKFDIPIDYKTTADKFSFDSINDLIYEGNRESLNGLQLRIDNRIFPDLIASLYQKMYENGFGRKSYTTDALLTCSYNLQSKGYQFLGFIKWHEELSKKGESDRPEYISKWSFEKDNYDIISENTLFSKETINDIFKKDDFGEALNIYFVAGSQYFEMLDSRIRKAALLMANLTKDLQIPEQNSLFILSGRNNAKISNSKVQFSNESLAMRNLLLHRLTSYLKTNISDNFINEQIESEINSRDSKENIEELVKKIDQIISENKYQSKKQFNLFIVSSSFHLLQLSDHIESKKDLLEQKFTEKKLKLNLFLVGAENPGHYFKVYDAPYIKLLTNEVVYRNFKFNSQKHESIQR